MPPSAASSATFGEVLHIARKLAYLVLELVLSGFDFLADSLAHFIDFFGQFRVAFELLHLLEFDAFLVWRNAAHGHRLGASADLCLYFCLTAFDIVKYNSPKERHKLYQIPSFECKLIASDRFHGCFCTNEPGFGQRFVFISHSKFRSSGVDIHGTVAHRIFAVCGELELDRRSPCIGERLQV